MLNKLGLYFDNRSRYFIGFCSFLLVKLIGFADYFTGYELSFSIFYLLPVSIAAWFGSKNTGLIISCYSAVVWFLVDHFAGHLYSNAAIPFWNSFVRLSFFILITLLIAEIKIRLQKETQLARQDSLTGLMSAGFFKDSISTQFEIALRYNHIVSVGYVDLDNFKFVNDTMGHSEGDTVLRTVGSILKSSLRTSDLAGRLGGDEFAIFLPETDREGAGEVFLKIQSMLIDEMKRMNWPVGFSIGVAVFSKIPVNADAALKFADNLMYSVKKSGKGRIVYEDFQE
jgi:diguanylate cyclase (GGDEF)-like protein